MVWRKLRRITIITALVLVICFVLKTIDLKIPYARLQCYIFRSNDMERNHCKHAPKDNWKTSHCKPHQTVVFLKTHKTGSTTMTSIFNRYADRHDLRVALPALGPDSHRFRWPTPFHWSAVDLWRLDGNAASILCNHARYNRPAMQLVMRNGAKYVTIVRHPIRQYESMFDIYNISRYTNLTASQNPVADFFENPASLLNEMRDRYHGIPLLLHMVKNPMTFDLGLGPPGFNNLTKVKQELKIIERDFDLVLITEYFDESLILLKKALCWQFKDILYVRFNERPRTRKLELSSRTKQQILDWNSADWMLYKLFNETLWKKIREYGPDFWDDLRQFREMNTRVQKTCVDSKFTKTLIQEKVFIFKLNVNVARNEARSCTKVLWSGMEFLEYFRAKFQPSGSYQSLADLTKGIFNLSEAEPAEKFSYNDPW